MTAEPHPSDVVLLAFTAGTLEEAQLLAMATHVRGCVRCRAFVRVLAHAGGIVLDALPPAPLAGGSLAAVMARLEDGTNGAQADAGRVQGEPASHSSGAPTYKKTQANQPWRTRVLQAAAAVLFLTLGAAGGWFAREWGFSAISPEIPTGLGARAVDAHAIYAVDRRHPVEVVAAERNHLNAWLSHRIQHQIAAPDLTVAGYSLLGGRLLSDRGKPAALFMYEDAAGDRLTVLVALTDEPQRAGSQQIVREHLRAISWSEGPLALAVTGTLDSDRLQAIGEIVRTSVKG